MEAKTGHRRFPKTNVGRPQSCVHGSQVRREECDMVEQTRALPYRLIAKAFGQSGVVVTRSDQMDDPIVHMHGR